MMGLERRGLVVRAEMRSRGTVLTAAGWARLGLEPPTFARTVSTSKVLEHECFARSFRCARCNALSFRFDKSCPHCRAMWTLAPGEP